MDWLDKNGEQEKKAAREISDFLEEVRKSKNFALYEQTSLEYNELMADKAKSDQCFPELVTTRYIQRLFDVGNVDAVICVPHFGAPSRRICSHEKLK